MTRSASLQLSTKVRNVLGCQDPISSQKMILKRTSLSTLSHTMSAQSGLRLDLLSSSMTLKWLLHCQPSTTNGALSTSEQLRNRQLQLSNINTKSGDSQRLKTTLQKPSQRQKRMEGAVKAVKAKAMVARRQREFSYILLRGTILMVLVIMSASAHSSPDQLEQMTGSSSRIDTPR